MRATGATRALALTCLLVGACAEGSGDPALTGSCVPGTPASCVCPNGSVSTRVCDPAGTAFGLCECTASPVGPAAAGSSAMAGAAAPPTSTSTGMAGNGMSSAGAPSTPMTGSPDAPDRAGAGGVGGSTPGNPGAVGHDEGVPATEHCAAAAQWDPMWVQFEEEVLMRTNEARAQGATCGDEGSFGPAGPLAMNAELRCSARLHSQDMGEAGYFAHDSQNGDDPFDRMGAAGYEGRLMGENIAKGQQTPAEVVDGWMNSPGHCKNIMTAGFSDIGIGYWQGESDSQWFNGNKLWTQNFGAPLGGGGTSGSCPWGPPWC